MADYFYIFLNLLPVLLLLAPFGWHLTKGNSSAVCVLFYNILVPFLNFVNAVIWANDAVNRAPIFCDIVAKLRVGSTIGGVIAPLCLAMFLSRLLRPGPVVFSKQDKRRQAIFDYSLCFGWPIFVMATHYLWQPARFALWRTLGCTYTGILVWPCLVLYLIWPPVISLISSFYGAYIVYRLLKYRIQFDKLVTESDSALTRGRIIRLSLLCSCYIFVELPLSIYSLLDNFSAFGPFLPYDWDHIHLNWGAVYYVLTFDSAPFFWYGPAGCALIVALFLGFASESREAYLFLFYQARFLIFRIPIPPKDRPALHAPNFKVDASSFTRSAADTIASEVPLDSTDSLSPDLEKGIPIKS